MSRNRLIGTAIAATAALLALVGCTGGSPAQPAADDKSVVFAATSDIPTFDTALAYNNAMPFLQPVYDTLIGLDANNEYVPMLATSWGYTDDENRVFELTLRDDVLFSDGTPLTAEAVVAFFERFKDSNGPFASTLASLETAEAIDDATVRLTLSAPIPSLEYDLTQTVGMVTNPDASPEDLTSVPAGTGPYVLDEDATRRGDVYVFTRNEQYYDAESFPFATVELRVLSDPTARLNAVKTGQVDASFGTAGQLAEAEASGLKVARAPGDQYGLFLVDRAGAVTPPLGDVRVRQAINYAIDGDALLESVAFGEGVPTTQIFAVGSPAFDPSLDDAYPFDPERARELLDEAGYPEGFTLKLPASEALIPTSQPIVQQQLADVGITVEYTPVTVAEGLTPYVSGAYSAYAFLWPSNNNWTDAKSLLSASGQLNPFHVDDPKIAELLDEIANSHGDEQGSLYQELNEYVVDQAWFDMWYVADNLTFYGADIEVTPQPGVRYPVIHNIRPAG